MHVTNWDTDSHGEAEQCRCLVDKVSNSIQRHINIYWRYYLPPSYNQEVTGSSLDEDIENPDRLFMLFYGFSWQIVG